MAPTGQVNAPSSARTAEWTPDNVRVKATAPGFVRTDLAPVEARS